MPYRSPWYLVILVVASKKPHLCTCRGVPWSLWLEGIDTPPWTFIPRKLSISFLNMNLFLKVCLSWLKKLVPGVVQGGNLWNDLGTEGQKKLNIKSSLLLQDHNYDQEGVGCQVCDWSIWVHALEYHESSGPFGLFGPAKMACSSLFRVRISPALLLQKLMQSPVLDNMHCFLDLPSLLLWLSDQ